MTKMKNYKQAEKMYIYDKIPLEEIGSRLNISRRTLFYWKKKYKWDRKRFETERNQENFNNEGRPDKWTELAEATKKQRKKQKKWPGQILQVSGQLASSISTQYDENSAVIGSNLDYAAIHQLGGQTGKNKKVEIPARPYLKLTDDDLNEILGETEKYLNP